ncbi:hypothetical protein PR048_000592 [Dryococelus australis]|uniref:Alpha-carbonic anhydrase domain-containing protein n=1 Tax=Dryococelus australis TaxID=614101 RepID=A0ABQ9IFN5_9NEOP|nr:hypothetical protein PR048_000592 [Dryococelus australis]
MVASPTLVYREQRVTRAGLTGRCGCLVQVSGTLYNTGQTLAFRVDKDTKHHVNITEGPLAYRYQFEEIYIHYGTDNQKGSEHRVQGYSFPAEVSTLPRHS